MTTGRVTRRFVDVNGRAVHMRMMGSGPPALFIHSSPANSSYVVNDMAVVADRYTCFAFDTPGFGLSDALPGETPTVAQLADAFAGTLAAIGMPPCPVFGTHTGASIALELGIRHPDRVTGLVLDGLASFSDAEYAGLGDYFAPIPSDPLGGHFASLWTRLRDQAIWFPWNARAAGALNEADLPSPEATHRWMAMYLDAADSYVPAYRAALTYRDGPAQVARLTVPAIFTAIESDMLYLHLGRIAPKLPTQEIRRVGNDIGARRALAREGFARFGSNAIAPEIGTALRATELIARQFVDAGELQLLVRSVGDPAHPTILIVHDVPGAGDAVEPLMLAYATDRFVIAFDLPGCGETTALDAPGIDAVARLLWQACAAIDRQNVAIHALGFGSSVAVEMAAQEPQRVTGLTLDGLLLADAAERADLRAHFVPEFAIRPDGSHWFAMWQMIRDMGIWWPWFSPTRANLRRVEADFDALSLHGRTVAAMKQPGGHAAIVNATLDQDAAARLAAYSGPVRFVANSVNPLATAFDKRARSAFPAATWIEEGRH